MGADLITKGIMDGQAISNNAINSYNAGQNQALTQEVAFKKLEEQAREEKPIMLKDLAAQVPEHLQFGTAVLANKMGIVEGQKGQEFVRTKAAKEFFKGLMESPLQQSAIHASGLEIVTRQQKELEQAMAPYKIKVDGTMQSYEEEAKSLIEKHTRERAAKRLQPDVNYVNDIKRKAKENQLKYSTSPEGAADIKAYQELQQKAKQLDLTWNQEQETLGKIDTYRKKLNERFGNDIGGMVAAGKMKFMDAIRLEEQAKYEGRVQAYEMERAWKEQEAAKDRAAGKYAKTGRTAASDANTKSYALTLKDGRTFVGTKRGSGFEADGKFIPQTLLDPAVPVKEIGKGGGKEKAKLELRGGAKPATPTTATPAGESLYDKYKPKK